MDGSKKLVALFTSGQEKRGDRGDFDWAYLLVPWSELHNIDSNIRRKKRGCRGLSRGTSRGCRGLSRGTSRGDVQKKAELSRHAWAAWNSITQKEIDKYVLSGETRLIECRDIGGEWTDH